MAFVTAFFVWIGFSAATAATLATITISALISTGLGFLARLLAPKPPKPVPVGRDFTVNAPDAAWQIVYGERVVGGSLFAIETAGANNEFLYVGIVWCYGGPDGIESIDEIRFGDEIAVTGTTPIGKYTGLITVEHKLGTDAQAASTILTTDLPTRFSSTDKGSGHAYTVLKLKFNEQKFSDFSIEGIRAKLKGRRVLDPRTGVVAWTQNPVLCIRDYLSHTRFGLGYGQGLRTLPVIVDDAFNNTQANICDELVAKKAGGTRARYAMNMAFTTEAEPGQALQEMFVAMGGGPTYSNGQWRLLAGAWRPPGVTLTDGDLRGPVQMKMALGRLQTFNGVRGVFVDPTHWQPTNYPFYAPPDFLAEDGDLRIWKELDFTAVTDAGQAQQLAKLALELIRRPKRLILPCKFLAYELLPGDTFRFTHDDWVEKTFAVERIVLPVEHDEQGAVTLGVDVHAREEDPGIYYWNPSVEEGVYTPPPSPILPPPGDGIVSGAANRSYRPRSNPLTATDAGTNSTITIASFTMEVAGVAPAPVLNSGSITALAFDTLYFIAYQDAALLGGAVTYEAFVTKEDALKLNRFFAGSIRTPQDGGPDTIGNNDGGVGAQSGTLLVLRPTAVLTDPSGFGQGYGSPTKAYDADYATNSNGQATVTGALNGSEGWLGFQNPFGSVQSIKLKVRSFGSKIGTGAYTWALKYSTNGGVSYTTIYSVSAAPASRDDTITIASSVNIGLIQVLAEVTAATNGSSTHNIVEVLLEVQT